MPEDLAEFLNEPGWLNAPRLTPQKLRVLQEQASALGVHLMTDADQFLDDVDPAIRAAFERNTGTVLLRKGATAYEAFYEMAHARQWASLGVDEYTALGTYAREQHVFREIFLNRQQFSRDEMKHAIDYLRGLRNEFRLGFID